MNKENIAVIGFGYIGTVIGAVFAKNGHKVTGIDSDQNIVNKINNGVAPFNEPGLYKLVSEGVKNKLLEATQDYKAIESCEVLIITVGTPLNNDFSPDLSHINQIINNITPHLKDGHIVILKSTVPPQTTENIVFPALRQKALINLAFSPERIAEGKAIEEFLSIPIVVGGVNDESTNLISSFFERSLGVPVIKVTNATTAEMVKLAGNLWVDLNIALAHEIAKLSDKLHIDAMEIIQAANTLPKGYSNVNILSPSIGVGGSCLTKDPWFIHKFGQSMGLELQTPIISRQINDSMPYYGVAMVESHLFHSGKKKEDIKIAILGIAFKNNTGDCRFTPAKAFINYLQNKGYKLSVYDPLVDKNDARTVTDIPLENDLQNCLKDADCVSFLTGHDEFINIPIRTIRQLTTPGAVIFDGRRYFDRSQIKEITSAGMVYCGIGRQ